MSSCPQFVPFSRPEAEACEYLGPGRVVWSKGSTLLIGDSIDGPIREVARLARPAHRRLLGATRLGRRLAREAFYAVLPVGDDLFYCFNTEIGWLRNRAFVPIGGRARPSKILRGGVARMPDGSLVFGEYFANAGREAVHVYRMSAGRSEVELAHRFAPGEVRHVHRCAWDEFAGRVLVTTGDIAGECRLISFDPDFERHEILGSGGEDWRAITAQFTEDAIYFGTDAEFRTNTIRRLDRGDGTVRVLAETNGPLFHSLALGGGIVFFSAAELSPAQTSREAIAYWVDPTSETVTALRRWRKDRWPKRYFQFGTISVPAVESGLPEIPFSGTALRGLDGRFEALRLTA